MYDSTSGLSWLDWGITNWHSGVTETLFHLENDTKYYQWRLPTEVEVRHLITHLVPITIDDQPETGLHVHGDPAVAAAITNIWGYNIDYEWMGGNIFYSQGFFKTDDGWGLLGFSYTLAPSQTSYHVEFTKFTDPTSSEWGAIADVWSTLLVRDDSDMIKVPEPATILIFLLGFFGIVSSRFFQKAG